MNKDFQKVLLMLLITCFVFSAKSQYYMQGKYYAFSKNYISQVQIYPDSIVSQPLTWQLTARPNPRPADVLLVVSMTNENGNVYICVKTKTDTLNQKMLSILKPAESKDKFILAIHTMDERFTEMSRLDEFIKKDKEEKIGFTYYNEDKVKQMSTLASIDSISREKFIKICNEYMTLTTKVNELIAQPGAPKSLRSYLACSIRKFIYENGYNPLVETEQLDNMFRKFMEDPSLKELVGKIKG